MSVVRNEVRRGVYLDSVALMRIAQAVKALAGVEECGLMMATPANRRILADAGVLAAEGEAAGPSDIVLAVRARDALLADAALAEARHLLDKPRVSTTGDDSWRPRTLRVALHAVPSANLALVSVPGSFAAAEARKALNAGLNVMMFSDNVALADEIALKRDAQARGLLMMGPDCGTAIIGGVPLAFANVVTRGDIGIVGASGTGIQEVSCLISNNGGGISHAIGTGGRDLKSEVGGLTTLMALDLLDADPSTRHIVIISKPPAADVAARVLARVARSRKSATICFIGVDNLDLPPNARFAPSLKAAAELALGHAIAEQAATPTAVPRAPGIRGLFAGGTLCAEAQLVLLREGLPVCSNAPVPGASDLDAAAAGAHRLIDLGADEYTQGRPHPMIEPAVRDAELARAIADESVGVVLIDLVLGYGAHADPAGRFREAWLRLTIGNRNRPHIVGSITGTEGDPQGLATQREILSGIATVCGSNADAARLAVQLSQRR
jgi:FdrA protein